MLKSQLFISIALFISVVCAQNAHYTALLNDSLWFFEAQRSGKLPSDNRVPWYVNVYIRMMFNLAIYACWILIFTWIQ